MKLGILAPVILHKMHSEAIAKENETCIWKNSEHVSGHPSLFVTPDTCRVKLKSVSRRRKLYVEKNCFFGENKSSKLIFKWKFVGEKKSILRLAIALTVKLELASNIIELMCNWYVLLPILILL